MDGESLTALQPKRAKKEPLGKCVTSRQSGTFKKQIEELIARHKELESDVRNLFSKFDKNKKTEKHCLK